MAYNAALNTVYNHYLTSYASGRTTRYDAHKRSELRSIYNSIIKLNKDSPLYFLDTSKESQEFAIDLKENARQLRNTIASLGGLDENQMLNKKAAYSSNNDLAEAAFIGSIPDNGEAPSYNLKINSLASPQTNMGQFLPSSSPIALPKDAYSFDITINDLSYEFQYNIHEGETNIEIQERLSRLISNSDIGLNADVVEDGNGNSALRLTSAAAGLKNGQNIIFYVSDNNTSKQKGSVAYLGIDAIAVQPSNAEYLLNGVERKTSSNHFTIDKLFEVQLNRVSSSDEDTVEIGLKADVDSLAENIDSLINGYNSFLNSIKGYSENYPMSKRLINEMNHISLTYQSEFERIGISNNERNELSLDKNILRQSVLMDGGKESISAIKEFTNAILQKTGQVSLNPMQYVKKTIVAYKNPGHNYVAPYAASAYSGMMFNSYC